ncbi:1-pyrroline-5-carboxylate dehydrogenase [Virgibacillus natechei]|uniref:1-pyrroline-5-carboxylate dehydrogenase n=1 Tax=Virgibacillus natechei TaxID=1216297 RepID=A0ABS4IHI1_9BACI|nr:L-glutamate gamma-semialdehyde dehydrogenase [Virgibacillus natechei]MBP1970414.1 1-pyrroline-5-carboxylate dehydrogenase [Virgibacillus natechei]UZD13930.1 L-glutamate gamma-semialdehyde dehydrogenase [Virgibacillus natechei]
MVVAYKHEPFTDFSVEANKNELLEALKHIESDLGKEYPLIIGGERITTEDKIVSKNPANKEEVIGYVSKADNELAEQAMKVADETFSTWRKSDPGFRAGILFRAAAIVRRRKFEFIAHLIKEGGKPWKESDADVAEGIDFLEYYGRQILELGQGAEVTSRPIEYNQFHYIPLGVGIVISPWNFLFAIMAGTTTAAMVSGNTVLLKPASSTPIIAYKLMEVLEESGMPAGVVNYIPGPGSEVGDYLVDHPRTRFVSFTGSRDVGTGIFERAAKVQDGQQWLKRTIIEMGGKDTIVVDRDADLELAAESIVHSAFGFSGQKCSACSRAVIHEDVYEDVKDRVVELTKELTVGNPSEASNKYMGPVIDQHAFEKIMDYIELGKKEGNLLVGGDGDDSKGYFINPTVFADVDPEARIMQEEIFGPVVGLTKAQDFDQAIDIANNTDYGLTGAVISNNRTHIEKAREDFHVGNLYFNRGCTAAIVGYHPFGGFNMSGTDSKAGGPDYLIHHMQGKTTSEMF